MGDSLNIDGGMDDGRGSDERFFVSDREDIGLAALEGLSLKELADIASREIGEARHLQAEAVGLSRRSTATLYRAGRTLWCARKKLKGKGRRAWTKWQKDNRIPTTSAWQAIRLYEEAEGEEAVADLTRTQALKKYGITKPRKAETQRATVPVGQAPILEAPPESPDPCLVHEGDDEAGNTSATEEVGEADQADWDEEPQAAPSTHPAAEVLIHIARRLEILEQDIRGRTLGDDAYALIDRAIATLRRLRGETATATEAA